MKTKSHSICKTSIFSKIKGGFQIDGGHALVPDGFT